MTRICLYLKLRIFPFLGAIISLYLFSPVSPADEEDTYNISLVQTAEIDKEIVTIDDKKVLTETYTAKDGDYIWSILRKKKLLNKNNLGEVLSVLKKLNKSLANLDLIHPGEKIIIPLIITPVNPDKKIPVEPEQKPVPLEDIKNLDYYTIRPGDSLIKVINDKYSVPMEDLYNEYLDQLKKLNPDIKDLNNIYPGQKVRLPIYSPKVVRRPINQPAKDLKPGTPDKSAYLEKTGAQLRELFGFIGEEWIHDGKHFIPLKTGGQIDLNTESYPVINLRNGKKIIIDLFGGLPRKMAALITSNWENYEIVHLTVDDTLNSALRKILSVCSYNKIYSKNEGLVFKKDITIEITSDWIINRLPEFSPEKQNFLCINLINEQNKPVPSSLSSFLNGLGVKMINYPPELSKEENPGEEKKSGAIDTAKEINTVLEKIFEINGQEYSLKEDIPIYQGQDSDFNLTVKADYFFRRNGHDFIIDLKGLGEDIIKLLAEHNFSVLTLSGEMSFSDRISSILEFLEIEHSRENHVFSALPDTDSNNVIISVPGIYFKDRQALDNFISDAALPEEILPFLSSRIDRLFYYMAPETNENRAVSSQ